MSSETARSPAALQEALLRGHLRWKGNEVAADGGRLASRFDWADTGGLSFRTIEAQVFVRVLCGDQQKRIAPELDIAPSTASHAHGTALKRLGIKPHPVPLPLIVAVQHACGVVSTSTLQVTPSRTPGGIQVVISLRRPEMRRAFDLTDAEQVIARLLVEGSSRSEIAHHRSTTEATVAKQLHSIFEKLRLFGRYALVRRAVELGCFD
jgi:DNA-binding NarL/FixJ family response regulator